MAYFLALGWKKLVDLFYSIFNIPYIVYITEVFCQFLLSVGFKFFEIRKGTKHFCLEREDYFSINYQIYVEWRNSDIIIAFFAFCLLSNLKSAIFRLPNLWQGTASIFRYMNLINRFPLVSLFEMVLETR